MRRELRKQQGRKMSVCHFLDLDHNAARPPVQAALGLAALGLDGPRPYCQGFSVTRKWQIVSGNYGLLTRLPLVGTESIKNLAGKEPLPSL